MKNHYSRKLRQLKQLNSLLSSENIDTFTFNRLLKKVKRLFDELRTVLGFTRIKRTIGVAAFTSFLLLTKQAQGQSFAPAVTNPFGLIGETYSVSKCAVSDIDADGDYDLMYVGYDEQNPGVRRFSLLENIGSSSNASFGAPQFSPFSLQEIDSTLDSSDGGLGTPTFVDIDNDGDYDLFTGKGFDYYSTSRIIFAENIGTANNPSFSSLTTDPFGITFTDPYVLFTTPAFVDIDNDGDQDLFVGQYYESILFFENTGTPSNPVFTTAVANPFNINSSTYLHVPTFVDMDGDGDKDLLMSGYGNYTFQFEYLENIGTASNPNFAAGVFNPFGLDQHTGYSIPSNLADMDGDGDKDLFTMFFYGSIEYFENTSGIGAGLNTTSTSFDVSLYPSPTADLVNILIDGKENAVKSIELITINGQILQTINGFQKTISLDGVEPGMYQIRIIDINGGQKTLKISKK